MLERRRLKILALLSLLLAGCGHVPPVGMEREQARALPLSSRSVVITNVVIVDVASGAKQSGMSVVIEAGRIAEIGWGLSVPPGAVRLDGTGKFLIPGLWDMHTHHQATGPESLGLFVANGVVGTRDMGSDVEFILPLRDRMNRGELLGPEIVAAGPILDDRPLDWPFRRRVTNAQEARQAVRNLKKRGVDFVKVHDSTPREAYFAIADEAATLGLSVAGHVPLSVKIEEAADTGIRSIEHLSNFRVFNDCSRSEPHNAIPCQALFEKLAAKGVWQTPTIAFFQAIPDLFSGKPLPDGEYASDSLLALMRKNKEVSKLNEEALAWFRENNVTSLSAIRDLLSSGSRFLAGSDGLVPGFSLHDELEWLTRAGLSPLQSLQTATINPARFLGREKSQGTIAVGKRADLVLLEADPLSDIRNTRRVGAVLLRGQLCLRPELDRIIAARRRVDAVSARPNVETGAPEARRLPDNEIVRDFRSWLDQLAQKDEFSGAVLLAKGDEVLFEHAYGFADRAAKVPNKVDTKFYLASVTKVFTAVAILQLAQAGRFSLDDKLINVLLEYPNKETASKMTVRQLLTHTSGLGNFFEKFVQLDFQQYQTAESILPVFANDLLHFEPGTKTSYSNAGYLALGLIITRVSGQCYEDYLQKHIFEPGRMTNSGCATGETRGLNAIGGAHSTVEDLFRFSLALQNRKLLNKQYTDLELTGGAGMSAEMIKGVRIAGHIGGAPGMSTNFEIYPEKGYTVVILSTVDGAAITVRDRLRQELTRP